MCFCKWVVNKTLDLDLQNNSIIIQPNSVKVNPLECMNVIHLYLGIVHTYVSSENYHNTPSPQKIEMVPTSPINLQTKQNQARHIPMDAYRWSLAPYIGSLGGLSMKSQLFPKLAQQQMRLWCDLVSNRTTSIITKAYKKHNLTRAGWQPIDIDRVFGDIYGFV